ncbi:UDP-glucose 4-epimerase GalE [Candidatus Sumerlaeota bacterium]|nr:UDP-glucose 4-epimerase GalE [Candidatus Sumerlaeota bacterium]
MTVCVIGGAGYIGSITVERLLEHGRRVIVYDNLSRGHRAAVPDHVPFIQGDHGNRALLEQTLKRYDCRSVMHFSALSLVGESVRNPLAYYDNNLTKGVSLLQSAISSGAQNFIFSSTAAVYGQPIHSPITEDDPTIPTNPYGNTKLAFERLLWDVSQNYNLRCVALRYFNAAGASEKYGEDHDPETHLIPLVLRFASGDSGSIQVFGNQYPTRDGTCIRDYIHVLDLAEAHILALEYLEKGGANEVFNLGNGTGFSVLEVIETAHKITRKSLPFEIREPRPGDPAELVASSEKIKRILGWNPRYPALESIIESAWKWHLNHPKGYLS